MVGLQTFHVTGLNLANVDILANLQNFDDIYRAEVAIRLLLPFQLLQPFSGDIRARRPLNSVPLA